MRSSGGRPAAFVVRPLFDLVVASACVVTGSGGLVSVASDSMKDSTKSLESFESVVCLIALWGGAYLFRKYWFSVGVTPAGLMLRRYGGPLARNFPESELRTWSITKNPRRGESILLSLSTGDSLQIVIDGSPHAKRLKAYLEASRIPRGD